MKERLLAVLLAGALVAPQANVARERTLNDSDTGQTASEPGRIPLPPIPYLEAMPWLMWKNGGAGLLKIDTLLAPTITPSGIIIKPRNPDESISAFS